VEATSIEDIGGPGLRVLFCGINPGLLSAAKGQHFARPGNRFWPALYDSGWTPSLLTPDRQHELLLYRLGITNLAARPTAKADELATDELRQGAAILREKLAAWRPEWLAVTGIGAYRVAFGARTATVGPQPETLGETRVWLLPNPSGLNAHYTRAALADAFRQLRLAAESGAPSHPGS
jgi:double-stranded uracil-DNA glycosylase